ncbi:hypothetical protein BN871_AJ_00800 [Paenibacillus sp. P22]|nr:hypothetical protein BN871_AJ_00800 [Paenibacillus sp. P22]
MSRFSRRGTVRRSNNGSRKRVLPAQRPSSSSAALPSGSRRPPSVPFGRRLAVNDRLDPSDLAVGQPHLDPMRMRRRFGQQILHDASGQLAASLVLLEHDIYGHARPDRRTVASVHPPSSFPLQAHNMPLSVTDYHTRSRRAKKRRGMPRKFTRCRVHPHALAGILVRIQRSRQAPAHNQEMRNPIHVIIIHRPRHQDRACRTPGAGRHLGADSGAGDRNSRPSPRKGRYRTSSDRHRQNACICSACPSADQSGQNIYAGFDSHADARACHTDHGRAGQAGPCARHYGTGRIRRARRRIPDSEAQECRPACRRGDSGQAARPFAPGDGHAELHPHARARRGRPDAPHGLPVRSGGHYRPMLHQAPDDAVLGHHAGCRQAAGCPLHGRAPGYPHQERGRDARRHRAACRHHDGPQQAAAPAPLARDGESLSCGRLLPHEAARQEAYRSAAGSRRSRRRAARRSDAGQARSRHEAVPLRKAAGARRDGRSGARSRRRRRHPRVQL